MEAKETHRNKCRRIESKLGELCNELYKLFAEVGEDDLLFPLQAEGVVAITEIEKQRAVFWNSQFEKLMVKRTDHEEEDEYGDPCTYSEYTYFDEDGKEVEEPVYLSR